MRSKTHTAPTVPLVLHHTIIQGLTYVNLVSMANCGINFFWSSSSCSITLSGNFQEYSFTALTGSGEKLLSYLLKEVLFGQAEVPQLDMQLVVNEDIPRLDIAMQDAFTNIPELDLCTRSWLQLTWRIPVPTLTGNQIMTCQQFLRIWNGSGPRKAKKAYKKIKVLMR